MEKKVKINIGGKDRTLFVDLNAMCNFDLLTGKDSLNANIFIKMSAVDVRALLFCALKHEDPDIELEKVGSWVTLDNFKSTFELLTEAYTAGQPEAGIKTSDDDDKKKENP